MLSAEPHRENGDPIGAGSYGRSHYNRFRTYDPSLGRYLEADPVGQFGVLRANRAAFSIASRVAAISRVRQPSIVIAQQTAGRLLGVRNVATPLVGGALGTTDANLYSYALGAPVNIVDPEGLADLTLTISGGEGFGGAFSLTLTDQGTVVPYLVLGTGFGFGGSLTGSFSKSLGNPEAPPTCPSNGNTLPPVQATLSGGTGVFGGFLSLEASPSGATGSAGLGLGLGAGLSAGFVIF